MCIVSSMTKCVVDSDPFGFTRLLTYRHDGLRHVRMFYFDTSKPWNKGQIKIQVAAHAGVLPGKVQFTELIERTYKDFA